MRLIIISFLIALVHTTSLAQALYPNFNPNSGYPGNYHNKIPNKFYPVIGVWVWNQKDLLPEGYKQSIDILDKHSPFNLIVPFLRFYDKELFDDDIYNQVKLAAEYANKKNIGLLPDLDVRSARREFFKQNPGNMQGMLRIKNYTMSDTDIVLASVTSIKNMSDHYSGGAIPDYDAVNSEVFKIIAYYSSSQGILPESIIDITKECEILYKSKDSISIKIPPAKTRKINQASVMASFELFYPDIFSPYLLNFQRDIIKKYSNISLSGVCKDEWGFPPYYPRYYSDNTFDFWYSENMAKAYSQTTPERILSDDCFLMALNIKGKETERQIALNHFNDLVYRRNVEIENDFYAAVKQYFGPDAVVTVHSTWWPYPDFNEMKKNGLSWWASRRDWAQTDEVIPFGVRTALSKKWNSPLWYNMYYTSGLPDQLWGSALAGGRIMYLGYNSLFDKEIMRAENRIRLLNYISKSPLDCQVAVIFGHPGSMNRAGPYFNNVGMELVDTLWRLGYPADLIPSSEIKNGSLKVDKDGYICYGPQRYSAIVLYKPEFEDISTATFFKAAEKGKTKLFKTGSWTHTFDGVPVDEKKILPASMISSEDHQFVVSKILEELKIKNIMQQTPAISKLDTNYYRLRGFKHITHFPSNSGMSNLIDGTRIITSATNNVSGDTIKLNFRINGFNIFMDVVGIAGVRLDKKGDLEALACSGLKYFKSGKTVIKLVNRTDIAIWKNPDGKYEGVIQAKRKTKIPSSLLKITKNWSYIHLPVPPENTN